jgi:hypothetical protein
VLLSVGDEVSAQNLLQKGRPSIMRNPKVRVANNAGARNFSLELS